MTTPSDTQSLILSRAANRPGNLALPLPEGLVGAAAKMVVGKMIARGWLEEVEANLRRGEPMWRETGDGHGTTLIATEAGLEAIGIEPVVASAVASVRKARPNPEPGQMPDDTDTAKPVDLPPQPVFAYTIKSIMPPCGEASRICRLPVASFSRSSCTVTFQPVSFVPEQVSILSGWALPRGVVMSLVFARAPGVA